MIKGAVANLQQIRTEKEHSNVAFSNMNIHSTLIAKEKLTNGSLSMDKLNEISNAKKELSRLFNREAVRICRDLFFTPIGATISELKRELRQQQRRSRIVEQLVVTQIRKESTRMKICNEFQHNETFFFSTRFFRK